MGTELLQRGAAPGTALEELNLTNPALVRAVHRDYLTAGAQVIETNTFGANRFRLGEHYLEMRVADINRAGALLAVESRNASGTPVLVAGAVGPLGRAVEPIGAVKLTSARRMFEEQLRGLLAGGVDLLVLETFTALSELELALIVVRELAPDVPVIAEMSVDEESAGRADELAAGIAARLL